MLSLEDCLALSELSEAEVLAIAHHERLPEIAAAELGSYLVRTPTGEMRIKSIIRDDIAEAGVIGAVDPAVEAVVPRIGGFPEPLLAVYDREILGRVRVRLADGRRKAAGLLDDLRVRWIDEPALRAADPTLRSFQDVDTPDDLVRWQTKRSDV